SGWDRGNFSMGRPVREVSTALRKITGTKLNETEVFMTFLDGGEPQRAMERKRFYEVASRWADWWKTNWNKFVDDSAFADARLPAPPEAPPLSRFLTGANVQTSQGEEGMIAAPFEEKGRECCISLALNRTLDLPKNLRATNSGGGSLETISAWAARANVDLLGSKYT